MHFNIRIFDMSILVVGTVAFDSIETPFGSAERVLGGLVQSRRLHLGRGVRYAG